MAVNPLQMMSMLQQMDIQQKQFEQQQMEYQRLLEAQNRVKQAAVSVSPLDQQLYEQNVGQYDDLMSQLVNANTDLRDNIVIPDRFGGGQDIEGNVADLISQLTPIKPAPPSDIEGMLRNSLESALRAGDVDQANTLSSMMGRSSGGDVFGQQLRGYGTDVGFFSMMYGAGKVPTTPQELEKMTMAAAKDPDFAKKRTEWSNMRIANTMESKGLSATDPTQNVVQDRFGNQYLMTSKGDTVAQQLTGLTTEEVTKLSEYGNTFKEIGKIREAFDKTFVGIFDGNWNNLKSKFANTPEFQKFKSMGDQLRTIIYGLSGKQINETEQKWLDGILAKIHQPDENYTANLDVLEEWIKDRHDAYQIELRNARRYTAASPISGRSSTPPTTSEGAAPSLKEKSTEQLLQELRQKLGGGQ
jgi:hypothetical protein